jgi:tetratricopeptide (TPR) repeat protein
MNRSWTMVRSLSLSAALAGAVLLAAAPAGAVLPEPAGDPDIAAARGMIDAGRAPLALELLEAVLARLPGDPDVLTYIAFAHRRQNNAAAAEAAYRAALATNPNHPGALAYQGSLFLQQGRRAEAEANLARLTASCGGCTERETLARELAAR